MESNHPTTSNGDSAPRELELKLFVPPSSIGRLWRHPLISEHACGPMRVSRIDNRYFDTAEHDLARQRMALRLRRIGRNWLQTLKTSATSDGALSIRGEWEMPVAGAALQLTKLRDTPLASIGSPRTLARRLRPVFTTNFRRESRMLRLGDGSEVEFAFDVGSVFVGRGRTRRSLPICEVEIELVKAGDADAATTLLRFAARLARDVPLIPLAEGKAARGYRLANAAVVEPFKAELPEPHSDDHAGRHLANVLTACNGALLGNAHALVEGTAAASSIDDQIDFIHQARVAIRRMRSALITFPSVAKGHRFDTLDKALRDIGRVFGAARDLDVFATATIKRLDGKIVSGDDGSAALADLRMEVDARRAVAHRALMDHLDAGSFGATTIAVMRIVLRLNAANDAMNRAAKTLGDLAPVWLGKQRDRVIAQSRRIAVLDLEERHRLRIEVKRLRYGLDLLEKLYEGESLRRFHDALAELQTKLGKLNDESVGKRLLQTFDATPARDLVLERYSIWLERHVQKQLPKIAASSVEFELTPPPWEPETPRTFG
jgi:triphosphatase